MSYSFSVDEVSTKSGKPSNDIAPGIYEFEVCECAFAKDQWGNDNFEFTAVLNLGNGKEKAIKYGRMGVNKKDGSPNKITQGTLAKWLKEDKRTTWKPSDGCQMFNGKKAVAEFQLNSNGWLSFKWVTFSPAQPIRFETETIENDDVPF
jgi:hypothetical protein